MNQLSSLVFGILVLSLSTTISSAAEFQSLSVTVPKGENLSVRIPPAWRHTVLQPAPNLPPTLKITTLSNSLSLQITFLPDPEGHFATRESADRAATQANQHYVAGSVEKRLTLTQIVSTNGHGCFATFTDADLAGVPHPRPGEFKNVVSGLFVIKKQVATFTLLTNDNKSAEYRQALQVISDGISVP